MPAADQAVIRNYIEEELATEYRGLVGCVVIHRFEDGRLLLADTTCLIDITGMKFRTRSGQDAQRFRALHYTEEGEPNTAPGSYLITDQGSFGPIAPEAHMPVSCTLLRMPDLAAKWAEARKPLGIIPLSPTGIIYEFGRVSDARYFTCKVGGKPHYVLVDRVKLALIRRDPADLFNLSIDLQPDGMVRLFSAGGLLGVIMAMSGRTRNIGKYPAAYPACAVCEGLNLAAPTRPADLQQRAPEDHEHDH